MSNKDYKVDLCKQQMTFSAAHFITFAGNVCERLHGHNYAVRCQVSGKLDENGYVVDFIALRDALSKITSELDHHMLLPTKHPMIQVQSDEREVTATFDEKRWIFPKEDCVLLPIKNTTAELLASYIADRLIESSDDWNATGLREIEISVDENEGQWGSCQVDL